MNRIINWLTVRLSRSTSTGPTEQSGSDHEEQGVSKEVNPGEPVTSSDLQANIDDLMPDIYGEATGDTQPDDDTRADDDTQPNLEIIENPSRTSEIPDGTDPYNTGGFKILKK